MNERLPPPQPLLSLGGGGDVNSSLGIGAVEENRI